MTYFTFVDNNDLLASQLNGNFNQAANLTGGTQTFAGPIVAPSVTTTSLVFSGAVLNPVTIVTAAGGYTVLATDYLVKIKKTVAATTAVTLPSSPVTGRTIIIKDGSGNANSFNITISGSVNIDGASSVTLNQPYASVTLVYDGVLWSVT